MNTYTLFKAVGGAAIGLLLVGCNRDAGAASLKAPVAAVSHAVPVHVAPVTYDDTALPVRVSGTLSRRTEAALSFKIGGVVDVVGPGRLRGEQQVYIRLVGSGAQAQIAADQQRHAVGIRR